MRRGVTNYDLLCVDVVIDTSDLLALAGGQFHVGFAVNFGTSLSRHYVGNSFPIQLADVAGAQPKLTYLSYTQALAENRLTVRLGRLTVIRLSAKSSWDQNTSRRWPQSPST